MSFSNQMAADILNGIFQDPSFAGFASVYAGLSSTTPAEDGTNVTEPSGGAYARVQIQAADMDPATVADPAVKDNGAELAFVQATADWLAGADLTHVVLYSAVTAGTFLGSGALTTAKPVLDQDTARFAAGNFSLTLD